MDLNVSLEIPWTELWMIDSIGGGGGGGSGCSLTLTNSMEKSYKPRSLYLLSQNWLILEIVKKNDKHLYLPKCTITLVLRPLNENCQSSYKYPKYGNR